MDKIIYFNKKRFQTVYKNIMKFWDMIIDTPPRQIARLLGEGVEMDVNSKDPMTGLTPLMWSSTRGSYTLVQALLQRDADVNDTYDLNNQTALIFASIAGNDKVINILIQKGADIRAKTINGDTALMFASFNGYNNVVRTLLTHGAPVDTKDHGGRTALMDASSRGHNEVVRTLLTHGAQVDAKDHGGLTALMIASQLLNTNIMETLLEYGADSTIKNDDGKTVLDMIKVMQRISESYDIEQRKAYRKKRQMIQNSIKKSLWTGARIIQDVRSPLQSEGSIPRRQRVQDDKLPEKVVRSAIRMNQDMFRQLWDLMQDVPKQHRIPQQNLRQRTQSIIIQKAIREKMEPIIRDILRPARSYYQSLFNNERIDDQSNAICEYIIQTLQNGGDLSIDEYNEKAKGLQVSGRKKPAMERYFRHVIESNAQKLQKLKTHDKLRQRSKVMIQLDFSPEKRILN